MERFGRWLKFVSRLGVVAVAMAGCSFGEKGQTNRMRPSIQGGAGFSSAQRDLDEVRVRLLEAVLIRDKGAIQPLLTPDFSWREDEMPLEETPFDFWERHRLWESLSKLVKGKTVRMGGRYVAPFEARDAKYSGPKLAWRRVGEEWRLAYFLPGAWTDAEREKSP